MEPLRILFVGLKFDAGDPRRGLCYEYVNFLPALARLPHTEVSFFAFDVEMRKAGRAAMNRALIRAGEEVHPRVIFFVLLNDEILPATITRLSRMPDTLTLNWFGDDHWRFLPFTRRWAPLFTRVVTTDAGSLERYHACGFHHVIRSQWGFNPTPGSSDKPTYGHDVTFVGQAHSHRRTCIASLQQAGIAVLCHGRGWEHGSMPETERERFIRESRINLNFTESWMTRGPRPFAKSFINRRANGSFRPHPPGVIADHLRVLSAPVRHQIKGRNFEIPGTGGFILTDDADDLRDYFVPGEEIGMFADRDDLVANVRYYLSHETERERIRLRGYQRAMRDHTYEQRFLAIFRECGIDFPDDPGVTHAAAPRRDGPLAVDPVQPESEPWTPKLSVIFPTRNEVRFIEQCLNGFLRQTYPSDRIEIVIADDSTDGTREILDRYRERLPRWLIVCDNPGGSIPQGYARALERSTGDIVCCFIGHAVPAPDYAEKIVGALNAPGCDLVGGSVEPIASASTRTARGIAMALRNPLTLGPNAMTRRVAGRTSSTHWMAVTREWVDRCGTFDPACTRLEDCDWYERMLEAGASARFDPAIRSRYFARESYGEQCCVQVLNAWYRLRLFSRTGRGLRWRHLVAPLLVGLGAIVCVTLFPWKVAIAIALAVYGGLVIVSTLRVRAPWSAILLHASVATVVVHTGHLLGMGAGAFVFGLPTIARLTRSWVNTLRSRLGAGGSLAPLTIEGKR